MEKFVEEPRHIEIQVAGDQYGNVCHLSERDCSIQRRHQKLVEESPSPFMTDELRYRMGEAAKKAAGAINYESVGTVEFLVDKHRNFYFMEMNTRIQVEHCVTEEVVNYDLIKEQIKIAMGDRITGQDYIPQMHSIECRINAEDPYNDFRPITRPHHHPAPARWPWGAGRQSCVCRLCHPAILRFYDRQTHHYRPIAAGSHPNHVPGTE